MNQEPLIEPTLSVRKPITFPELVFNQVFKDFFNAKNVSSDDVTLLKWLEIAGNVYTPVNLVDADGNVVGVVPPILNRATVDNGVNIVGMTQHYDLVKNRHAGSATKHLNHMTTVIGDSITVDKEYTKSDWDKVNPNKVEDKKIDTKIPVKNKKVESDIEDIVYD